MDTKQQAAGNQKLRSRAWFDNPDNPGMTALYLERYLNYGLTLDELRSGKPIIGIAQTGSDLSPCNRHHLDLAKRVRDGITAAGGVAFEFPCHPIQETGKRPTASLDRNLAYLGLVEVLYGYFLDGVVLLTGCDKTTPACLMAAATVNIPAISLNVGPMLNGWSQNERLGSGTVVWKARERHAAGDIDYQQFIDIVASSAPSVGHCNTMGTASTMNALAEALGMSLPGSAAIPAPYRERGQMAYETGRRIGENCRGKPSWDREVIRPYGQPLKEKAGFLNLKGTLFDSAIMKTSVISPEFQERYLNNPEDPNAFEGRVVVFDGPEDYHHRIDDPSLDINEHTILIMRGAGPIGYPGAAEVVNMQPPGALIKRGVLSLPCIGDGRQSGTSGTPSILNASPEAAAGGGLALLQTGDRVRIDLNKRSADILLPTEELERRRADLQARGGFAYPASQTPWQEIQRSMVDQLSEGMTLKPAVKYQKVAQTFGVPRDNH